MTSIQIANLALAKIGENPDVTDVTGLDTSLHGTYAALFYPQAMGIMLNAHAWSFAVETATLTAESTNNNPLWWYAYQLPSDFLNLMLVVDANFVEQAQQPADSNFSIESNVLYTNINNAVITYVSNAVAASPFTPPAQGFSALFVEALATLLAAYFAGAIIKGAEGAAAFQKYMQLFEPALASAMANDAQYRKVRPLYIPEAIRARWGYGLFPGLQAGETWAELGPVGSNNIS